MTQDIESQLPKIRKLHAAVLKWRWMPAKDFLLEDEDFRFAADCERMRVDRNGSVLSLLLVKLNRKSPDAVALFSRVLEGRLRVTDTPGLLKDGRVAVLLPDTAAEGAWKVAEDVSEVYPPGPGRPECDVLVYPNHGRSREFDVEQNESSGDDTEEKMTTVRRRARDVNDANPSDEFFFARQLPLWKRLLDILGGAVGLIVSMPILTVAAAAVKATSRGPVFFQQLREGHGGEQFTMWKLRTMRFDAEEKKPELREFSQQDGPAFKMKRDPRTTSVGRFLRWSSIDELPQFWNVIRGDMSLVGPRPLPVEESQACQDWQRRRLQVVPGMTCTWQVCERGNVTFDEWVRMDLRYVKQHSFAEDMRLLMMTLPSLLFQKGMR